VPVGRWVYLISSSFPLHGSHPFGMTIAEFSSHSAGPGKPCPESELWKQRVCNREKFSVPENPFVFPTWHINNCNWSASVLVSTADSDSYSDSNSNSASAALLIESLGLWNQRQCLHNHYEWLQAGRKQRTGARLKCIWISHPAGHFTRVTPDAIPCNPLKGLPKTGNHLRIGFGVFPVDDPPSRGGCDLRIFQTDTLQCHWYGSITLCRVQWYYFWRVQRSWAAKRKKFLYFLVWFESQNKML